MSRFVVLIVAAFAASFVGASWAMSGFPIPAFDFALLPSRPTARELRPSPDMPTFHPFPGMQTTEEPALKRLIEDKLASFGSEDPTHDVQRHNVLREAMKYTYSGHCLDRHGIIRAITEYIRAYQAARGCGYFCSSQQLDMAWKAFSSPLDHEIRSAIQAAYDRGHVSTADFPPAITGEIKLVAGLRSSKAKDCTSAPQIPEPPRASRSLYDR